MYAPKFASALAAIIFALYLAIFGTQVLRNAWQHRNEIVRLITQTYHQGQIEI